jgi:hypothetical protein
MEKLWQIFSLKIKEKFQELYNSPQDAVKEQTLEGGQTHGLTESHLPAKQPAAKTATKGYSYWQYVHPFYALKTSRKRTEKPLERAWKTTIHQPHAGSRNCENHVSKSSANDLCSKIHLIKRHKFVLVP